MVLRSPIRLAAIVGAVGLMSGCGFFVRLGTQQVDVRLAATATEG